MSEDDTEITETDSSPQTNEADVDVETGDVGGDQNITVENHQENQNRDGFAAEMNEAVNGWAWGLQLLLSILPLSDKQFIRVLGGGIAVSFPTFYLALVNLIEISGSPYAPPLSDIQIPFAGPLFTVSLVTLLLFASMVELHRRMTCPECGAAFALRIGEKVVYPEYSDDEHRYGERTYFCTNCEESVVEDFQEEKGQQPDF